MMADGNALFLPVSCRPKPSSTSYGTLKARNILEISKMLNSVSQVTSAPLKLTACAKSNNKDFANNLNTAQLMFQYIIIDNKSSDYLRMIRNWEQANLGSECKSPAVTCMLTPFLTFDTRISFPQSWQSQISSMLSAVLGDTGCAERSETLSNGPSWSPKVRQSVAFLRKVRKVQWRNSFENCPKKHFVKAFLGAVLKQTGHCTEGKGEWAMLLFSQCNQLHSTTKMAAMSRRRHGHVCRRSLP